MKNKKIILVVGSLLMYILFFAYKTSAPHGLCDSNSLLLCTYSMDSLRNIFNFFPIILLFSLLTYPLSTTVFTHWWRFARLAIPVVFALVLLINLRLHHSPGGWLNLDTQIDTLLVVVLYGIFAVGSLVQIIRGYRSGD